MLTGTNNGVGTLQSFWFIKSDQLGKVSVGKQSQASDNTAILVDGSGSLVPANWVVVRRQQLLHPQQHDRQSQQLTGAAPAVASGVTATVSDELGSLRLADIRRFLGFGFLG